MRKILCNGLVPLLIVQVQKSDRDYLFWTKCLVLKPPVINITCMCVSFARPIEFSIAISASLEELELR